MNAKKTIPSKSRPPKHRPPKSVDRFLFWFLKGELLEEILGDLHEYHDEELQDLPKWKLRLFYWFHVFNFLRPFALKKLSGSQKINQYGMLKNYMKTSFRSIKHNLLFSSINVVGLAISMTVGIIMIVFIKEIYSFDDFFKNKENIYRVTSTFIMDGEPDEYANTSIFIGNEIDKQVPGVEEVVILRTFSSDLYHEEKGLEVGGCFASSSFFDVFSFELIKGNKATALDDPDEIVLTQSFAKKMFEGKDPIGKTLQVKRNGFIKKAIVTGVIEDPPINSHFRFEALVSLKTLEKHVEGMEKSFFNNWMSIWNHYVYVVLNPDAEVAEANKTINSLIADMNAASEEKIVHHLQPLSDIVPSDDYSNEIGAYYHKSNLIMMVVLTCIVLLSACFNYTNLSLALALKRCKEVGIRKVIGASRGQIGIQIIIEAVLLSLFALSIGLLLFLLIRTNFVQVVKMPFLNHKMFTMDIGTEHVIYLLSFGVMVGCLGGILPALMLSKLKAKIALVNFRQVSIFGGFNFRRSLIVLQFALSIGLITFATIVSKQYEYALNYDLGFTTKDIINVEVQKRYALELQNELNGLSEVEKTSRSAILMGIGWGWGMDLLTEDRSDTLEIHINYVSPGYLSLHDYEFIAGSGFEKSISSEETPQYIVINEKLANALGYETPDESIGKSVWYQGDKLKIVGVTNNFISDSLIEPIDLFAFMQPKKDNYRFINVKLAEGSNFMDAIGKVEQAYRKFDDIHPFEAKFYDDAVAATYQEYKTTFTIVSFLAFLAISISTLGLIGITVFTMETRMKEISIRKVLGAPIANLIMLLSRSTLGLIVLSGVIAIPLVLYFVEKWILSGFVYRIQAGIVEILSGLFIVFLISAWILGWQIRRAALQNPADLLRDE